MKTPLLKRLEHLDMTNDELAGLAGLHKSHISRLTYGDRRPTLDAAFRIAKALKCKIEDVFKA